MPKQLTEARIKLREVMHSHPGLTNDEIIAEVMRLYPEVAKAASEEIGRMGWLRMINEAGRRTNRSTAFRDQGDLFGDIAPPDFIAVPVRVNGRITNRMRIDPLDATGPQILAWIGEHRTERKPSGKKTEMVRIFAQVTNVLAPFLADGKTTLRQAIEKAKHKNDRRLRKG